MSHKQPVSTRIRQRQLSSARRAGAWSRRRAIELQKEFLRQHWVAASVVIAAGAALSLFALLIDNDELRWFFLGAWTTAVLGLLWHVVIVASGSARLLMADQAEQWTRHELKRLRRTGWRIVHHVLFRSYEDIDTIILGPAGAVVVETKWASEKWDSPGQRKWIASAVAQVADNAALVERQLRQQIGNLTTRSVVALWPAEHDMPIREIDGITVLPGTQLRAWINSLPTTDLTQDKVHDAWAFIENHVARRDANDLARQGPDPRSPGAYLFDLMQYPTGAFLGIAILAALLDTMGWPNALLPGVLLLAASVGALRFGRMRRLAAAFFVAAGSVLLALAILSAIAWF